MSSTTMHATRTTSTRKRCAARVLPPVPPSLSDDKMRLPHASGARRTVSDRRGALLVAGLANAAVAHRGCKVSHTGSHWDVNHETGRYTKYKELYTSKQTCMLFLKTRAKPVAPAQRALYIRYVCKKTNMRFGR